MVFGAEYGQQEAEEKDHQTEAYQAYYSPLPNIPFGGSSFIQEYHSHGDSSIQ